MERVRETLGMEQKKTHACGQPSQTGTAKCQEWNLARPVPLDLWRLRRTRAPRTKAKRERLFLLGRGSVLRWVGGSVDENTMSSRSRTYLSVQLVTNGEKCSALGGALLDQPGQD